MKILIESTTLRQIVSKKDGTVYFQQAALVRGERLAGPTSFFVEKNNPYPVGEYEMDLERCFSFGSFGRLEFTPILKQIETVPNTELKPNSVKFDSPLSRVA